jgi:predicted nuclease of predicted toxin-antitoxin system
VRVLLDENFPLRLHRALLAEGYRSEHVIELGARGMSDAAIMARLENWSFAGFMQLT